MNLSDNDDENNNSSSHYNHKINRDNNHTNNNNNQTEEDIPIEIKRKLLPQIGILYCHENEKRSIINVMELQKVLQQML
jgi:hypothetical protein